ncbi:hypothetical protein INR49_023013 [Caranx melampygus]|nr:hypothetical protein INR49_023013 [Caranx melampygus]
MEPVTTNTTGSEAAATRVQSPGRWGSSPRSTGGIIPLEYRSETVQLVKLAGPVFISQSLVFMVSTISMVFCGHLGKTELAGVSLAAVVVNISGMSVGSGLSSTCDTLISQTYGSGNLKRVGVILQRGILILLLACFPCWAVLINTEPLLLAVKQSPEVASGSAAANAISQYLLAFFLYVYIRWRGLHKATWGGWSLDCLQEWGPFVKLAIPSMLMICLSWWIFEIGGFLAGVISEVELGAQTIAYQLCITAYMFPLGFSTAASVRVGNALGAGNTKQAKLSCKVAIFCAFIIACFVGAGMSIARNVIGCIFTSELDIIKRVADVMLLFGFMHVGDATAGVAAGVLRGAGKQLFGALCNLVGLYLIGFPIGVSLMFAGKKGIVGLWTGLTICASLQAIVFITFLYKLDWKKTTEEAIVRAGVQITEEDSDQSPILASTTLSSSMSEDGDTDLEMLLTGHRECTTEGDVLSITQLVLRRGLTLLIMVIILITGIVISQLMIFMISFVSTVFCGHLGKTELAGVSLSIAVVNVTGISIGTGLSLTCDTLISQTYGSGNLKRVGVILQRGILILLLACFPCWAVLINTEPLLLAVKQSPEVARLSQLYVKIFMPALPAAFMYQLQGRYLQNQEIIWPQVITGTIGNVVNAIINYVFLFRLELGVAGSAAANAISQYVLAVALYVYICCRGLHKATWAGWSLDCLQEWGPFVQLAIPSMLMLCLEWWMFEVGGFLAGVISEAELGAQSITYELAAVAYMFPLGFSAAASVRVGNALGAGNIEQAKLSSKVPIICAFIAGCFVGATLSLARNVVGYIFTSEQDILQRVSDVMFIFGFMHVVDAIAGVAGGVVRGVGKQLVGALCNLVGYYFIGFPIGVSLMFAANMGIVGLWTGLTVCVLMQSIFFLAFLWKLNWKKAAEEALVRAGVQVKEEKEMDRMENTDPSHKQAQASATASSCETADDGHTYAEVCDPGQSKSTNTTTVGEVLSVTQLVLRRGLTLLVMVVILVAGVLVSDFLIMLLK